MDYPKDKGLLNNILQIGMSLDIDPDEPSELKEAREELNKANLQYAIDMFQIHGMYCTLHEINQYCIEIMENPSMSFDEKQEKSKYAQIRHNVFREEIDKLNQRVEDLRKYKDLLIDEIKDLKTSYDLKRFRDEP
tara:strand:- start:53 stop:457 length:405 start_codon:yes stop_codon:yes gene_type:complete